jgi:hypothetical protein
VNNGEIIILYRSFNNLHVAPCEPGPEVNELCQNINSIDLEKISGIDTPEPDNDADHRNHDNASPQGDVSSLETFEADNSAFEGLDPEQEYENVDSSLEAPLLEINPLDHLLPLPSTRMQPRRRRKPRPFSEHSQPKRATTYNIAPRKAGKFKLIPRQPRYLSKEESKRVLRNGVGKIPLVRVNFRTPSKMEPPSTVPQIQEVEERQTDSIMVVNGRLVRARPKKSLPPTIREIPTPPLSPLGSSPTNCVSVDGDLTDQDEQSDPLKGDDDSTSESSPSSSGSSHYDPDRDELLMASCMEGVSLSFIEPHEVLEPAPTPDLPECFQIPYDPEIADIALQETLQCFGISANALAPVDYNALDHQDWEIEYRADQQLDHEATMMPFDARAWNASFYSQEATISPPAEYEKTFVEDYYSALPLLPENSLYQSAEAFAIMQANTESVLASRGLGTLPEIDPYDFSFLHEPLSTHDIPVQHPAYFIPVLPEPEPIPSEPLPSTVPSSESPTDDYGDGSQFLVEFEDEEPCEEPFIPIFTEDDFLPESERYRQNMPLVLDFYSPGAELQWPPVVNPEPPQFWHNSSFDVGVLSETSAHTVYPPFIQPVPHLPLTSPVESDGIGASAEESSTSAQKLIDFLISLPGSLVSSVTSLIGSSSGSQTESTRSKSTPGGQQLSPPDFSDSDDFKEELTAYANLRVYGTTSSPYDDPNYYPILW